jgi:hypothetical protein
VEGERRAWIRRKFASFAAPQVGVKHEPAVIHRFEQHQAGRRLSIASDGRQRHGSRLGQQRAIDRLRRREQRAEMLDRVHSVRVLKSAVSLNGRDVRCQNSEFRECNLNCESAF